MKTSYYKNMGEITYKSNLESFLELCVISASVFVNVSFMVFVVSFLSGDDTLLVKVNGVVWFVAFLICWNFFTFGMLSVDNKNSI